MSDSRFSTRQELRKYVSSPYRTTGKKLREALEDGITAEDMPDQELARLWDDAEEGLAMIDTAVEKIVKILEAG